MADNIKSFITDELNTPDVKPVSVSKLYKSVMGLMNGTEAPRLAFERDPSKAYASDVYIAKERLLPDSVCKRLALKDSLVGTILQTRYTQLFPFGRPRPSRSEIGYTVQLKEFVSQEIAKLPSEQKQAKLDQYAKRIAAITKKLRTCGDPHAASDYMSFSQYVGTLARQGMTFGRVATEIITKPSFRDANEFSYFRPVDAGTIYKARPLSKATHEVRERAIQELNRVNGSNISGEKLLNDEYTWVQVIQDGSPKQAFTSKELVCHSFFPSLDFELEGYPVTPMDLAVSEIVSHIHLTDYNRLYFESGRSAKQILLIKSNDMDEKQVDKIRQAFQAQIIGNANSHRLPLFAVDENEDVTTVPLEGGAKDMEFQYLSDMTARIIFSAFMMAPDELAGWTYLSKGSSNQALCLDPKSEVYVENQGLKTLWSILDGKQESYFNVWTGKRWEKARVFETGVKASVRTKFRNGMSIDTSPDHRFLGVGPDGILDWIPQKDLKVGQFVLQPMGGVPGDESAVPSFNGHRATPALFEVLGWLTGDGNISIRQQLLEGRKTPKTIRSLTWYYHHSKEIDIWNRHYEILKSFALNPKHHDKPVSEQECERIKRIYGVQSVAPNRLSNKLYSTEFVKWLISLGFTSSADGKSIPDLLFRLPESYRAAFLRGLFSADGTRDKKSGAVRVVIHDERIRLQTKKLLGSLGVRVQAHEGLTVNGFTAIPGKKRTSRPGGSTLTVKDKDLFYEKIGFLQSHKQPLESQSASFEAATWDKLPSETAIWGLRLVKSAPDYDSLSKVDKNNIATVLNGKFERGLSRRKLISLMKGAKCPVPAWILDHRFESVTEISDLGIEIPMVDVEVYDDTHAFVANGMIVHNSESNAEFKLTKITDMGIRPILANIEDYLNLHILPLFDPEIADDIVIKLCGLDAETPEKESIRIQQDQNLHCDYDEIRTKVDKPKIGKRWGGEYPFNPYWRQVADQFIPVGIQLEHFFGVEGASKDPKYDYLRDPFYFQQQQLLQQAQMMQAQEAAQSQQAPDAPDGPSGEDPSAQGDGGGDPQNLPKNRDPNAPTKGIESKTKDAEQQGELADNLTEAVDAVSKSLGILATTDREAFLAFAKSVRGLARKKG